MPSLKPKTGKAEQKKIAKPMPEKTAVQNLSAKALAKTGKKTVLKKLRPLTPERSDGGRAAPAAPRESGQNYIEGVGRRKTSIARVRIIEGGKNIIVNGKDYATYFPTLEMKRIAHDALDKMGVLNRFEVEARISGGGIHSQAEALRHGLARALIKYNADFRKRLKKAGYLKRDPRMKERRKFGLKKARKSPQWKKR
ncbi:MAG: 30S ribosomal protein S9 [Patescibacteria group bacterium]